MSFVFFGERGTVFFFEKKKTAKGPQSRGPSAHPSGFFWEECLVVEGGSFVDLCLYAAVLDGGG